MCDIFIMCFVLCLFIACFGWNFNAIVVVEEEEGGRAESSTTCIALYKTFHCGNDKLTPTLVGIVSVSQNLRSTLLLPFHSVSTLTGMFNDWVWSLTNVTAKASCSRSSCVRVNGMFNALVWSFDFDLRDMSNIFGINTLLNNIDVQLSNN